MIAGSYNCPSDIPEDVLCYIEKTGNSIFVWNDYFIRSENFTLNNAIYHNYKQVTSNNNKVCVCVYVYVSGIYEIPR